MKWFRAGIATGFEKIDHKKSIIFGVAINTEGEAKGHGVHLDAEFVEECTRQGNEKKNGLKCRFGHPNASSTAFGTFLGRYKNFRTEYTKEGNAVSRADLHLSETAKKTPNGNLHKYVLEMADKEPDMFGTSIVFSRGKYYKKTSKGKKAFYNSAWTRSGLSIWYTWEDGKELSTEEEKDLSEKLYVELDKLHQNDVVDEPAANPDGLFSAFSSDQLAAKVTELLDQNPEILEVYNNEEARSAFLERYESYKKHKQEMEAIHMGKPNQEGNASEEENKGFFSRLKKFFSDNKIEIPEEQLSESGQTPETAPAANPENQLSGEELQKQLSEAQAEISSLKAAKEESEKVLSEKEEKLSEATGLLKEANKKLSALGAGLGGNPAPQENKAKFKTYEDALAFAMDEKGMSYEDADKYCEENYMHLYPQD